MVQITKGEHGLLADGKPIDESSFAELSDEELKQTSGGVTYNFLRTLTAE